MARSCRNPECVNGLTPGVAIVGKGNKDKPVLGQTMRWGWLRCTVCTPKANDATFKFVARSAEDIAQRAQLASTKAEYKPKSEVNARLGRVASSANGHAPPGNVSHGAEFNELMKKVDKLVEGQSELLDQIKELRAENKELKAENLRLKSVVNEKVAN